MVAINFTLFIEVTLFLIFLWGLNRLVFRPLLRTMDAREAKIERDKASAETDKEEAKKLDALYTDNLTNAHQIAAQQLHKARYDAYQKNRAVLDELRTRDEQDVTEYRTKIEQQTVAEREKFGTLLPSIIEAMDRQINTEGSLR